MFLIQKYRVSETYITSEHSVLLLTVSQIEPKFILQIIQMQFIKQELPFIKLKKLRQYAYECYVFA